MTDFRFDMRICIGIGVYILRVCLRPIITPLRDISTHTIKSKWIGVLLGVLLYRSFLRVGQSRQHDHYRHREGLSAPSSLPAFQHF